MIRIGVLTWQLRNYGTALQAYALTSYLNTYGGVDCRLLNYSLPDKSKLEKIENLTFAIILGKVFRRLKVTLFSKINSKYLRFYKDDLADRRKRFDFFYLSISHDSTPVASENASYFNNEFDGVVVGSDQVWNPKYFCGVYFGNFGYTGRLFSYAPSIGVSKLSKQTSAYLQKQLKNFSKISVREQTGQKILEEILPQKQIETVLDPTLLMTGDEWCERIKIKHSSPKRYILVYVLSSRGFYKDIITKRSKELGITDIVYILPDDNLRFIQKNGNVHCAAGPKEFLEFVYNAEYVITDSFHGVCFSIIFSKQFLCLERFDSKENGNENSRVCDLLDLLNLSDLYTNKITDVLCIDYSKVIPLLDYYRNRSKKYLSNIIQECKV